jgi:hypothetical protein
MEESLQNMWENSWILNPVSQLLGDDGQAYMSRFVVTSISSPLKKPGQFRLFPTDFEKLAKLSAERMFFAFKIWITERTSQSAD